jgi:hypothetical protein
MQARETNKAHSPLSAMCRCHSEQSLPEKEPGHHWARWAYVARRFWGVALSSWMKRNATFAASPFE